jgi:hypothetical protein
MALLEVVPPHIFHTRLVHRTDYHTLLALNAITPILMRSMISDACTLGLTILPKLPQILTLFMFFPYCQIQEDTVILHLVSYPVGELLHMTDTIPRIEAVGAPMPCTVILIPPRGYPVEFDPEITADATYGSLMKRVVTHPVYQESCPEHYQRLQDGGMVLDFDTFTGFVVPIGMDSAYNIVLTVASRVERNSLTILERTLHRLVWPLRCSTSSVCDLIIPKREKLLLIPSWNPLRPRVMCRTLHDDSIDLIEVYLWKITRDWWTRCGRHETRKVVPYELAPRIRPHPVRMTVQLLRSMLQDVRIAYWTLQSM